VAGAAHIYMTTITGITQKSSAWTFNWSHTLKQTLKRPQMSYKQPPMFGELAYYSYSYIIGAA